MYLNPHEAMELLQITTRQGLHKIVTNHNISVKSQGAGKPNLYLKSDLDRYMIDNKKNLKCKNIKVTEKSVKIKKEKVERIKKAKDMKEKVSEELSIPPKQEDELKQKPKFPSEEELKNPLNHIGQAEYDRIIDIMTENGTFKEQDRAIVMSYAISFQKYVYAVAASAMEDDTTMDQFGNLKLSPYFTVADKCLSQMIKIASVLGIGIRSRIGIDLKQPKKATIFDVLSSKDEF
jgi:phage terminase small subunit/nucleoid DNA-binding protein